MSAVANRFKGKSAAGNADVAILLIFFMYSMISQHFVLCIAAGISLVIIIKHLWKPYLPPVLLFFICFQWLQVFSSVLFADFSGESLDMLFNSKDTDFLFLMTFLQLVTMTFVFKYFLSDTKYQYLDLQKLKAAAERLNTRNVIIAYFISTFSLPFLVSFSMSSPSLYQLVLSFGIIKSMFTVLLFFLLLLKKTQNRALIAAILIFDFILSFASFFSNFKLLILMLLVAFFTVNPYLKRKTLVIMIPILVLLFTFLAFWTYVKDSYRAFLNQGSRQQVVAVSNSEALSFLLQKVEVFDGTSLKEGAEGLLSRIQYMERYSETYARVPSVIKHAEGKELVGTLNFLLVPRFINANKGIKDASEKTSYYTGRNFSKASQGTSISMGYFCDLYIDFGLYLMFLPLVIITAFIGLIYKWILHNRRYNVLFTYSLLIGTFLALGTFESDLLFFLGIMRNHLAVLVLGYFAIFPLLHKFILNKK